MMGRASISFYEDTTQDTSLSPGDYTQKMQKQMTEYSDSLLDFTAMFLDLVSNNVKERSKTKEQKLQYQAKYKAANAYYSSLEAKAKNHFLEETKRIHLDTKAKKAEMQKEVDELLALSHRKAEQFQTSFGQKQQINAMSALFYKNNLDFLKKQEHYIVQMDGFFTNQRQYMKLCEEQRRARQIIDKYLIQLGEG